MSENLSPRGQVAQGLAETCVFGGLNESYGVNISKQTNAKGKTYWSVTFAKARTLDGVIHVYSPSFILIKTSRTEQQLFKSPEAARDYLIHNFIKH